MLVQRPNPRSIGPQRHGVEQLGPAGAGLPRDPQLLQRLSGSALIKLEQTGALRRCPPPCWQSISQHPAGLRAKHVSCHTLSCRAHAFDVELGGSAAPPRRHCTLPARHSMARLARSRTQPSRELYCLTPLPPPFCEPARLFCRCEPDELPKDLAEELPKELRYV